MTVFDERTHIAEQQGQQQGGDVLSVYVRVCHQHDLVIAQFRQVEIFANPGAKSGDEGLDFFVIQSAVQAGFFYVEDFAAQRQDSLVGGVAPRHRRTACRIALDQENFAFGSVPAGAISQLAGH